MTKNKMPHLPTMLVHSFWFNIGFETFVKVPDNELIQDEFLLSEGKDLFIFLDLVPVQVHNC